MLEGCEPAWSDGVGTKGGVMGATVACAGVLPAPAKPRSARRGAEGG